jgi:hypothetical protein
MDACHRSVSCTQSCLCLYRDTGNFVYKTQNEDKHPFFITITNRQYRDTGGCLSSFCVLYTMLPVSLYCLLVIVMKNGCLSSFCVLYTMLPLRETGNIVKGKSLIDNTETQATLCTRHRTQTSIHFSLQSLIYNTETQATLCTRHRTKTSSVSCTQCSLCLCIVYK